MLHYFLGDVPSPRTRVKALHVKRTAKRASSCERAAISHSKLQYVVGEGGDVGHGGHPPFRILWRPPLHTCTFASLLPNVGVHVRSGGLRCLCWLSWRLRCSQ